MGWGKEGASASSARRRFRSSNREDHERRFRSNESHERSTRRNSCSFPTFVTRGGLLSFLSSRFSFRRRKDVGAWTFLQRTILERILSTSNASCIRIGFIENGIRIPSRSRLVPFLVRFEEPTTPPPLRITMQRAVSRVPRSDSHRCVGCVCNVCVANHTIESAREVEFHPSQERCSVGLDSESCSIKEEGGETDAADMDVQAKELVKRHGSMLRGVAAGLRAISWISSDGKASSEIYMELASTLAGLLEVYHDSVIESESIGREEASMSHWLEAVRQVDLLLELILRWKGMGKKGFYGFVSCVEGLKVILKLEILRRGKTSILLGDGMGEDLRKHRNGSFERAVENLHVAHAALARFRGERASLNQISHEVGLDSLLNLKQQMGKGSGVGSSSSLTGEVMQIFRPFVYALGLSMDKSDSWRPWLLALCMDVGGHALSSQGKRQTMSCSDAEDRLCTAPLLTSDELKELARRRLLWAYYLLREPCYTRFTKVAMGRLRESTSGLAILAMPLSKLVDFVDEFQQYWAYVSAG